MKLAIRAHDYGKMTIDDLASRLQQDGFSGVQLIVSKALVDASGQTVPLNVENASSISKTLKNHGIEISLLGAYFNPLHPNPEVVQKGIANFESHLHLSKTFGCRYVGTETGSYAGDVWSFRPENHSDEAFEKVVQTFERLQGVAKQQNALILVEPAYAHAIFSPDRLLQLFSRLDETVFGMTLDLFNLLNIENYQEYETLLIEALAKLGPKIRIFHLKNFKVEQGNLVLCALDEGFMDYSRILRHLKPFVSQCTFILEGVKDPGIVPSKHLIDHFYK